MSDAYLQNKSAPGHSRLSGRTQWYMGDEWSGNCIFHPVPLCLCSLYTHYTTGNTCNASRRDFWQRGGGNNFRTPASPSFLPPSPPSRQTPRLDALMSAIDLVAGDNSFHRRDTPWWSGAPWTPRLIPGPCAPARLRQRGSVSDAWRVYWSATAGRPERSWRHSLHFRGPRHAATAPHRRISHPDTLAVWLYCVLSFPRRDISFRLSFESFDKNLCSFFFF